MSFFRVTLLGSGSNGNCTLIETPKVRILVDAGFSGKQIAERLAGLGLTLADIQGVLITHEHSDHVMGLPVLANRWNIPVYCNRLTAESLKPDLPKFKDWRLFRTGESLDLEDLTVDTFPIPHDAYDPCGFVFHRGSEAVGFLTDLGYATKLVVERVRASTVLILEANHDVGLLRADTKRPWGVKQRILARHGHLSNEAAATVAAQIVTDRLRHLFLGHLSEDCNRPELAEQVVKSKLEQMGVAHVQIHKTFQGNPNSPLEVEGPLDKETPEKGFPAEGPALAPRDYVSPKVSEPSPSVFVLRAE